MSGMQANQHGKASVVSFGVWNTARKEWQFGIHEPTSRKAWKVLYRKIGNDARKWRFEIRKFRELWKMDVWEKVKNAANVVESGAADRIDLKELNIVIYKAGTVLRIDFKGVFEK